jgi:hypothetical protein
MRSEVLYNFCEWQFANGWQVDGRQCVALITGEKSRGKPAGGECR